MRAGVHLRSDFVHVCVCVCKLACVWDISQPTTKSAHQKLNLPTHFNDSSQV